MRKIRKTESLGGGETVLHRGHDLAGHLERAFGLGAGKRLGGDAAGQAVRVASRDVELIEGRRPGSQARELRVELCALGSQVRDGVPEDLFGPGRQAS